MTGEETVDTQVGETLSRGQHPPVATYHLPNQPHHLKGGHQLQEDPLLRSFTLRPTLTPIGRGTIGSGPRVRELKGEQGQRIFESTVPTLSERQTGSVETVVAETSHPEISGEGRTA